MKSRTSRWNLLFNEIEIKLPAIFVRICIDLLLGRYDNLKNVTVVPGIFGETSLHHLSHEVAISRELVNIFDHFIKRGSVCFTSKIQYRDSQLKDTRQCKSFDRTKLAVNLNLYYMILYHLTSIGNSFKLLFAFSSHCRASSNVMLVLPVILHDHISELHKIILSQNSL